MKNFDTLRIMLGLLNSDFEPFRLHVNDTNLKGEKSGLVNNQPEVHPYIE